MSSNWSSISFGFNLSIFVSRKKKSHGGKDFLYHLAGIFHLLNLFRGIGNGSFSEIDFDVDVEVAATVMLVSGGYPGNYEKGEEISGFENAEDSLLFHSGTKNDGDRIVTNGGRVLAITSFGKDVNEAVNKSFINAEKINFKGKYYRKDIGFDL